MRLSSDKTLLFRSHACSKGLDTHAIQEICDAAELIQLEPGEVLHHSNQPMTSVHLIVHGRLKQTVVDINDKVLFERYLKRGSQFGALAAARFEPVPIEVVAVETSSVLKLDFEKAIQFTRTHEQFGLNLTQAISGMVREVLMSDRRPKHAGLVIIFHESSTSYPLTERLLLRLKEIGESICLMSNRAGMNPSIDIPFHPLVEDNEGITRENLRRKLNEWSDGDRIVIDIDSSLDPSTASLLIEFSDQVIWCCDVDDIDSSIHRLKAMEAWSTGRRDKISLVTVVDSEAWVAPMPSGLADLTDRRFKVSFSKSQMNQGRALSDGLERLVHHLRGVRIGLALGGGGARGMAHLGVLKALEDNGIVVDMIAGTSAGAMTGILHAAGFDPSYIVDRFAEDLKPGRFFRLLPGGKRWYLVYKYRRGQFGRMLRKYLSDWNLEQLAIPVHSVTVDLVAGMPVMRQTGNAVDAVLESINLPVFSKPICRDGQALVDGGLVDNIPADILVRRGCNFVIAVSVTSALEAEFAGNLPTTATDEMRSGSMLQTLLRSYLVQHVNMNSIGVQPADVVIEPAVAGVDLSDFSMTKELADVGEQTATDTMANLKSLLSRLDSELFAWN